jgi:hypothetical protein
MKQANQDPDPKGFISYAHKDYELFQEFKKFLRPIGGSYRIDFWSDERRSPSFGLTDEIILRIRQSTVMLLLASSDSLNSDYVMEQEIKLMKKQQTTRGALLIPVLLTPCSWAVALGTESNYVPMTQGELVAISKWRPISDGFLAACEQIGEFLRKDLGLVRHPKLSDDDVIRSGLGKKKIPKSPIRYQTNGIVARDKDDEVTDIVLSGTQIKNLSAISNHLYLLSIKLRGRKSPDLRPLANLVRLQSVDLKGTLAQDLTPLASVRSLERLDITGTKVSNLTPLANLENLGHLNLSGTPVTNLAPLCALFNLRHLDLDSTHVSDLSPARNLINLQYLDLARTAILDISPIAKLHQLQYLALGNTKVSDLSPLEAITNLLVLYLNRTQVSRLEPISTLRNLRSLTLSHAPISDVRPLSTLDKLRDLDLTGTKISDLTPLTGLKQLRLLSVKGTRAVDLAAVRHVDTVIDVNGNIIRNEDGGND